MKARQIACHLARDFTDCSLMEAAKAFGDFDRTSILHHARRVDSVLRAIGKPPASTPAEVAAWLWFRTWPTPAELRARHPSNPSVR